ncbi:hypothetical protein [Parabacteroides sp. PF5-6]|uniref:hypothetical protein n=1 Tax=Parabacteroides sp. PF5-6 TaxID=1742403 RepID=UPI002404A82E|nr:hypothetical protein [Parabacteroides sp. PF5-6]MDF9829131.1 hypothetical protein [Parabacteroides sp. PF5-6]
MKTLLKRIVYVWIAISAYSLFSCQENDGPEVIVDNSRSGMTYLKEHGFVIGIPEGLNTADPSFETIIRQLKHLSQALPAKGLSKISNDTIWILDKKGTNGYVPANEKTNPHAGSVVIGDKDKHVFQKDSLLLWVYLSELVYEKYLSAEEKNRLQALHDKVKTSKYNAVYYFDGTKLLKNKVTNAPATKSPERYLGEIAKSCYAQNNYYPFVYEELERFDPEGLAFVEALFGEKTVTPHPDGITLPPAGYTQWVDIVNGFAYTQEIPVDLWYSKYLLARTPGSSPDIAIVASRFVSDSAMLQCRYIVETMVKELPPFALQWMADNHFRIGIIGAEEEVTDLPENRAMPLWWPDTNWDERGRGYGATPYLPLMTCGEENIVYTPQSPFYYRYAQESIMVHEFAHNIDQGLRESNAYDPSGNAFETALFAAYANARQTGLWAGTYAMENAAEYWAEGVQAWFNTCRIEVAGPKRFTMKYRTQLQEYDPTLYALIEKYMPNETLTGYHFDFE